jgi:hypothetical protein
LRHHHSPTVAFRPAGHSLPAWQRDDENGPIALRVTKHGIEAIDVEDEAVATPRETSVHPAFIRE